MEQTLNRIPLFSSLSPEERVQIGCWLTKLRLRAGDVLFREGEPGGRLYIVTHGQLEIIKAHGTPEEQCLRIQEPGEYIGDMSLFDPRGLRTASVRARTDAELLELDHDRFKGLLQCRPLLAYEVARVLSLHLHGGEEATIRSLLEKNAQLARAYEDLKAAQVQIIESEKLNHELKLAREIQLSILPTKVPTFAGFEFEARMIPAGVVGGDFYDFIPLNEDQLGIAVGDVCGKGTPAAIFMAMCRSLMRSQARLASTPRQALEGVNRHVLEMNDAGMFVTVLYGVLDRRSRKFFYARAGHCLPIIVNRRRTLSIPRCSVGQALGVFGEVELDEQELALRDGDQLLIYTDGVTEAENKHGEPFGLMKLHQTLLAMNVQSARQFCWGVMQAIAEHQGRAAQTDDITLVVTRAVGV